jgi:subtilisin family serine protease
MRVLHSTGVGGAPSADASAGRPKLMDAHQLVGLRELMALSRGAAEVMIGLVDGPVALQHPDLSSETVRPVGGASGACNDRHSASCKHGTFVAGILAGKAAARAPGIAPSCTLLVRPVFSESTPVHESPSATPLEVAEAIVDCVEVGVHIVNLSIVMAYGSLCTERELTDALDYAVRRSVLIVAASGNQGALSGSVVTRHPGVIPVIGYSRLGQPLARSNLGRSIGLRACLRCPGVSA